MSENNLDEEQRERSKEAKFVDDNSAALIQRVTVVMPIVDALREKGMIHPEKYDEIRAEKTNQGKMRILFESLNSGGDKVKMAFYCMLKEHDPHLFRDLGDVCRKRELADPESPVPNKRLKTESYEQNNLHWNSASTSAPRPAAIHNVTYIINERSPENLKNIDLEQNYMNKIKWNPLAPKKATTTAPKKERKIPAPKKEKIPATKKEKKIPASKKEKIPANKKEKKIPAPKKEIPANKKEKKIPAPKKEIPAIKKEKILAIKKEKTPAPKKEKIPAIKKEKKTPAPKNEKIPTIKKAKKTPAPKKAKKTPAPKKAKKTPALKKAKKTLAPQKAKKTLAPQKEKKTPAPQKAKKTAARK